MRGEGGRQGAGVGGGGGEGRWGLGACGRGEMLRAWKSEVMMDGGGRCTLCRGAVVVWRLAGVVVVGGGKLFLLNYDCLLRFAVCHGPAQACRIPVFICY